MSELNNKDNNELDEENKENKENNINQKLEENEEEEDDIDSTNNLMDKLTFGCSNSSFKIPQINAINFDTNSNKNETEQNESEIIGINDEYKNIQSLNKIINKIEENNHEKESNKINNINNEDKKSINQSLKDLFFVNKNKNEIISIRSTKNDLASNDSYNMFRNNNPINQSLNNSLYGNKPKNDIISMNSNNNYNETNNDSESINQSLMNLIVNQNEIASMKSNEFEAKKKENLNLQEMFEEYENKSKLDEINKKISESGFIHIYEDNKKNKDNKHVEIIDETGINGNEKLYIFNNKGKINKNINIELPKKNTIDRVKYYEILSKNYPDINRKIHYSTIFSNLNLNKKKEY